MIMWFFLFPQASEWHQMRSSEETEESPMNPQLGAKSHIRLAALLLPAGLLLAGCRPELRVGELRTESQSVEAADGGPVSVEIEFGAGDLQLAGGAADLLEADFTYNVDELAPEVEYAGGRLAIRQPGTEGLPIPLGIQEFRNEWDLRLSNQVPMDLRLNMGAGTSDLRLAGLMLSALDLDLGAVSGTLDLRGDWAQDLEATIDTGAADFTVLLPSDVGVRVEVESGPTLVDASGLSQNGNVYTNAAYGKSPVTLDIRIQAGIGRVQLDVEE
jgi:hypothetical protein